MKKIATEKINRLVAVSVVKTLLISIAAVLLYSFIASEIIYRFDLSLDNANIFSLFTVALSALTISFFSCYKLKNNGLLLGLLSEIPLLFYSLINVIFNGCDIIYFLIKLAIMLFAGGLGGLLAVKRGKRFKLS